MVVPPMARAEATPHCLAVVAERSRDDVEGSGLLDRMSSVECAKPGAGPCEPGASAEFMIEFREWAGELECSCGDAADRCDS